MCLCLYLICVFYLFCDFPGGSEDKACACNVGDLGSIPGLGRSPGEGNGNPLQYSCLENPMDRGAWRATVHRVAKSPTRLSNFTSLIFVLVMLYSFQCTNLSHLWLNLFQNILFLLMLLQMGFKEIYLSIFDHAGFLLLCAGFLQLWRAGATVHGLLIVVPSLVEEHGF